MRKEYVSTPGEECANAVTHGVMALAALPALPFAAVWTYGHAPADRVAAAAAVSLFVISMFLMFLASTLYHAMEPQSRHKRVFRVLDHIGIYVAIAGSYTPVALVVLGGWQGVLVTALQWVAVLLGILCKTLSRRERPALSLTVYLVMGWSILLFFPLFLRHASAPLIVLIAAGGVCYTLGAWVYAVQGFRYHHMVWHLMIDLAVAAHFAGIVFFLY
ncbi:hemolysin III family protein [uncultured Alistipes sp.]|uniref:PAQR family membrane homeostasis protein TrhA n=1 Tax=uncultured Alistipes sp. TaxID=538949 RepID=UPI0026377557|nr:hemolysin III family protein [uncultured Alistipes sp.]